MLMSVLCCAVSCLQLYMLSVFCKLPIVPMSKMEHLQRMFLIRVLLSVFQFRVNKR